MQALQVEAKCPLCKHPASRREILRFPILISYLSSCKFLQPCYNLLSYPPNCCELTCRNEPLEKGVEIIRELDKSGQHATQSTLAGILDLGNPRLGLAEKFKHRCTCTGSDIAVKSLGQKKFLWQTSDRYLCRRQGRGQCGSSS